jgi:hypothetical protein
MFAKRPVIRDTGLFARSSDLGGGNTQGNKATKGLLLERTLHPGVYRRGSEYVVVYRHGKRQHKESAETHA